MVVALHPTSALRPHLLEFTSNALRSSMPPSSVEMDLTDFYNTLDIEGSSYLLTECDAFLQLPENTASAEAHPNSPPDLSTHAPRVLQPDSRALTSVQEVVPQQRQKRYAPRSRQGCLTCRARRKRCDAQHPICSTCIRVNAECRWPNKLQISGYSRGAEILKDQAMATTSNSNSESSNTQINNANISLRADEYPPAMMATHGGVSRSLAPQTMSARQLNATEASLERHLITYYIHTFIPQITVVQTPSNFFTSLYIPMAFHHTGILDAIFACAAAHLAKSVQDSEKAQELSLVVIQRQQLARGFITEHTQQTEDSEWGDCRLEVVVVLLLLIGLESQTGGRSLRWMQRVNCVRQLLQAYQASATKTWSAWEAKCVQRHFSYHDVMSLVMEDVLDPETRTNLSNRTGPFKDCAATLSNPRTEGPWDGEIATPAVAYSGFPQCGTASQDVDCLLGLSTGLFCIIAQLRDLPSRDPNLIGMDEPEYLKLETDLSNWQYNHEMALTLDLDKRLDLIALAECHRLAALILLYRRCPSRSYYLPHLASQIMSTVSRIAPASTAAAALTPILFLAGAELNTEAEIALCASRLKSIKEAIKMTNITSAEEVLRVVWEE